MPAMLTICVVAMLVATGAFAAERKDAVKTILGDGTGPCRIEVSPVPYALQKARDAVRALSAAERARGVEIVLAPGRYMVYSACELEARDSGLPNAPIVWRAEKPETVFVTTAHACDAGSVRQEGDGIWSVPIPNGAQHEQYFARYYREHEMWSIPIPDFFVDGKPYTAAQWPNGEDGWTEIASFIDRGWMKPGQTPDQRPNEPVRGGTFGFAGDRPKRWVNEKDCWLEGYWCYDWRCTLIQPKEINCVSNTITLSIPHINGVRISTNKSPRRWRARHVRCELDAPGEFYIDRAAGRILFCPFPGTEPAKARYSFATVRQRSIAAKGLKDVEFRNLVFEESAMRMMQLENCERVSVMRCVFRCGHDEALVIGGRSRNCKVVSCDFLDMGDGAVRLGGGDERTLERGDNIVEDCLFRRNSRVRLVSSESIQFTRGVGNVVRHCEITDQPHQAVRMNTNDGLFEYCIVSNCCTKADDAGSLYKGGHPICRGNVIRYCYFKDIRSLLKEASMEAIYFDDSDGSSLVEGCVFENAGRYRPPSGNSGAVYTNGGFSNVVDNCLFVDCMSAVGCFVDKDTTWKKRRTVRNHMRNGDLELMQTDLYQKHYPIMKGILEGAFDTVDMRMNLAKNSVAVDCNRFFPKGGWVAEGDTCLTLSGDPGFVDRKGGDLTLRKDSEVFKRLPAFRPIPFGKIGLLRKRDPGI